MKKFITTILEATVIVAMIFGFAAAAVDAWDNTMSDEEVITYLEQYPDEVKLQKIALKRNLICENEIIEGKWIKGTEGKWFYGAPEFGPWDGHCDFSKTDEYQKEDEIFSKAMELYDSSIESGCTVDFEECYNIIKTMYDFTE